MWRYLNPRVNGGICKCELALHNARRLGGGGGAGCILIMKAPGRLIYRLLESGCYTRNYVLLGCKTRTLDAVVKGCIFFLLRKCPLIHLISLKCIKKKNNPDTF